jgi:hypothetical protein
MDAESPTAWPPRRIAALALLAALAVAWAIPGPVDALVARQEAILLGRYTVGHFAGLVIATIAVGVLAALLWSRRSVVEATALVGLVALSTWAGAAVVATAARQIVSPRYIETPVARAVADPALRERLRGRVLTRQPDYRWDVVREDVPAPGRSYPRRVAGQPSRPVLLTTDDRGLRNAPRSGRYDVVVAGTPSPKARWCRTTNVVVAARARVGRRIYNTAVSGLSIREYLNNWIAFGLDSGARTLVVLLYEGNDWKPLSGPPPQRADVFDFALATRRCARRPSAH